MTDFAFTDGELAEACWRMSTDTLRTVVERESDPEAQDVDQKRLIEVAKRELTKR